MRSQRPNESSINHQEYLTSSPLFITEKLLHKSRTDPSNSFPNFKIRKIVKCGYVLKGLDDVKVGADKRRLRNLSSSERRDTGPTWYNRKSFTAIHLHILLTWLKLAWGFVGVSSTVIRCRRINIVQYSRIEILEYRSSDCDWTLVGFVYWKRSNSIFVLNQEIYLFIR